MSNFISTMSSCTDHLSSPRAGDYSVFMGMDNSAKFIVDMHGHGLMQ